VSGILVSFPATLTAIAQQSGSIAVESSIESKAISVVSEVESNDVENFFPAPAGDVVPAADRDESKAIARTFLATAYCLKGQTASGVSVRRGIIAADPKILPLGSVVRIQAGKYSGIYTVMDTGGAIKGRKIDIYIPTRKEAVVFGARKVKVEVLRHGWEPEVESLSTL